jgi:transposase InsO family protein
VTKVYRAVRRIHWCGFSIASICDTLSVSRSSYYAFEKSLSSKRAREDERLGDLVSDVFCIHRRRYGARRIAKELGRQGETCSRRRAGKLLEKQGLRAIQPKSYQPKTTDSRHGLGYNDNLLLDASSPTKLDQVWVGDITYIPLKGGTFVYMALLMDLFSRLIIVWSLQETMKEDLVLRCLKPAIKSRTPGPGLIHHSDRGGQYAGRAYRRLLGQWKIKQSMNRADNCYDNAFMESCFGTIKRELEMEVYDDIKTARKEIATFVRYYNRLRLHSSLDYQTPTEFEALQVSSK